MTPHQPNANAASSYIPTPSYIKSKKADVNIVNDDDCGASSRDYIHKVKIGFARLITSRIYIPLAISDVGKFKKLNENISIEVFAFENSWAICVYPVHITKNKDRQHHINLLCIIDQNKWHHLLINNMSRMFGD